MTNISEFENGKKVFKVSNCEMVDTQVSDMLCSNFIEVGFGYQVEGMWSEMLFNRSFEKIEQLTPATYDWFGGKDVIGDDWTKQEWYHTGYEHNRWYACPSQDRTLSMAPDCSFIISRAPAYSIQIHQIEGGVHGKHCLTAYNFEPVRMCGIAQNGKYLRSGEAYNFRGYFKNIGEGAADAELRFYETCESIDWEAPLFSVTLDGITTEGGTIEKSFKNINFTGFATFALFLAPGTKLMLDAFSLMPDKTVAGWREDVVDSLRRVNPKLIRFPGGCFASFHDWRDAIGPFDSHKPEPSYFWGDINYNDVGTDEFLQLCKVIGCESMLVVNFFHPDKRFLFASDVNIDPPGFAQHTPHGYDLSGITDIEAGVQCAAEWVEYCNGAVTTKMGALRAKNGHPEPYNVRYWEMDNETFRWFTVEEYAKTVIKYSKAMKAVDPNIKIGLCSYHYYKFFIDELLDLCGEYVDFLADRVCEPDNLAKKIAAVRRFNATHEHQIFYADTEALQNRDPSPAPFVGDFYKKNGITIREARRTWIYALSLVSNLMMDHRLGGIVKFMCFNNLANTTGQSCIETPKEDVVLSACGLIYEQMSRTRAAWPLKIDDYSPSNRKEAEIQAAWDKDRNALVIYLLNRCDEGTHVSLDFSSLGKPFIKAAMRRMSASGGRVQETAASHGNIKYEYSYFSVSSINPNTFEMPSFSFTELVVEAEGVV